MSPGRAEAHWPADTSVALDPRPIGRVLADHALARPSGVALAWPEAREIRSMTWSQLDRAASELAARLIHELRPGQRVAVAAPGSPDWLVLEYAAARAGTPLVPINPAFTDTEIDYILEISCARMLFGASAYRGSPLLDRLSSLARRRGGVLVHDLADWGSLASSSDPLPEVTPGDAFLVQFTSGTTGRPKGAILSHRAAYNCAGISMARLLGTPQDNWLNFMPMHHVGGSVSVVLSTLSVGAATTILPSFEPALALDMIERNRVTITSGVPTMLLAMLDHPAFPTADVSSLRLVQTGGSVVATSLIRRIEESFGAVVINAYGQSESPNALMTSPDDDDVTKAETLGRPLAQREVRIVGRDGSTLPHGEIGELVMRSPLVMDGYLGVDAETATNALRADGWLHTGDLCSMDEDGVVRIVGRARDLIIRGGENIHPAEVEDVLRRHPGVVDIAVVGVSDARWGEVPVGVYRSAPGVLIDPAELEQHARRQLASFKVPRRWLGVDEFPLTASGKIKKFELRRMLEGSVSGPR